MTTLAEKRARLERIVDAIVCADDPGDMPIDDLAWVANTLRFALDVVEAAKDHLLGGRPHSATALLLDTLARFEEAE